MLPARAVSHDCSVRRGHGVTSCREIILKYKDVSFSFGWELIKGILFLEALVMVMIILSLAALLISLTSLGIEIGITSWSIHRANRYKRRWLAARRELERMTDDYECASKQLDFLNEYASENLWLLNFLYDRYNKFADLEKELREGEADSSGDGDGRYGEMKRALRLIRAAARSLKRMRTEGTVSSLVLQLDMLKHEFRTDDEEEEPAPKFSDFGFGEDAGCEGEESSGSEAPDTESTSF
jgi:hypothetical protein